MYTHVVAQVIKTQQLVRTNPYSYPGARQVLFPITTSYLFPMGSDEIGPFIAGLQAYFANRQYLPGHDPERIHSWSVHISYPDLLDGPVGPETLRLLYDTTANTEVWRYRDEARAASALKPQILPLPPPQPSVLPSPPLKLHGKASYGAAIRLGKIKRRSEDMLRHMEDAEYVSGVEIND